MQAQQREADPNKLQDHIGVLLSYVDTLFHR